jgi:hypothetical protein
MEEGGCQKKRGEEERGGRYRERREIKTWEIQSEGKKREMRETGGRGGTEIFKDQGAKTH